MYRKEFFRQFFGFQIVLYGGYIYIYNIYTTYIFTAEHVIIESKTLVKFSCFLDFNLKTINISFDKNESEETLFLQCHHDNSLFVIRKSCSNFVWK